MSESFVDSPLYGGMETAPLGSGLVAVFGGKTLGNVDPRFTTTNGECERSARHQMYEALVPYGHKETFVITPADAVGISDVDDFTDQRISKDDSFSEINVAAHALLTRRKGVGLMLNPADCMPLVYAAPDKSVLSLIHIGWRGAVENLHLQVANRLKDVVAPKDAVAFVGPSISGQSYCTEKLHDAQLEPEWQPHITETDSGYMVDIPGFVISTLNKIGVPARNVRRSSIDTAEPSAGYFSHTLYKKDPQQFPTGRNGFVAMLSR